MCNAMATAIEALKENKAELGEWRMVCKKRDRWSGKMSLRK